MKPLSKEEADRVKGLQDVDREPFTTVEGVVLRSADGKEFVHLRGAISDKSVNNVYAVEPGEDWKSVAREAFKEVFDSV